MKKEMTEQEAYLQLAAVCAQAEHCEQEMRDKMKRWELDETIQNRIIERLVNERYIDEERYARAFVDDKIGRNVSTTTSSNEFLMKSTKMSISQSSVPC